MNLFISLPMHGKSDEEINEKRESILKWFKESNNNSEVELIDTMHHDLPSGSHRLEYLGESIKLLSKADMVYFTKDYPMASGCLVEMLICKEYNIPYMVEK